jgi:hypothetical protein
MDIEKGSGVHIIRILILVFVLLSSVSADNWQSYTIENGNFTIEFPGEPNEQTKKVATEFGNLDMNILVYSDKDLSYTVTYTDYPSSVLSTVNIDTFLINARKGAVKNTNGILLQDMIINYETYPGREVRIAIMKGQAVIRIKYFLVGNRLYQVLAALPPAEEHTETTKRFFDSFTLNKNADIPFIEQLLQTIGYTYETREKGKYNLTLNYDDERTQLIHIWPFISNVTSKEEYDIWSTIAKYPSVLADSIYQKILIKNGTSDIGRFQTFKTDDGYLLVYSAVYAGKYDAAILKKVILDVSGISDYFEKMITQKDDY